MKFRTISAVLIFVFASFCAMAEDFATVLHKAENGDTYAMHEIGVVYANGEGRPQDYAEAFKWFEKAAYGGQHNAMYSLAIMYKFGQGRDVDMVKALAWHALAAKYIPKNADEWFIPRAKVDMYLRRPGEIAAQLSTSEQERAAQLYAELATKIGVPESAKGMPIQQP
ncbi:MAG: sel1 repeat family protein [Methylophilaceae bacterium]|nr:sel1 repeat family protein [Methylophilaceae bacterium]